MMKTFDCYEPWYTYIKEGKKVVEGRICNEKYSDLISGDTIKLFNENGSEFILLKVVSVTKYISFKAMLEKETLKRVLPNIDTIEDGVNIYRKFYSNKLESKKGVLAIEVQLS